jgi:hypothetical protein
MSFQVDTALVNTYRSNIEIQFQQKGSRLRDTVMSGTQNAEFDFYDRIGSTDAVEVTTRHSDTPLLSTPHDRRRISLRDFDWADMIDRRDKIRLLADPTSAYTQNAVYAMGRKVDDVIISAATGPAYTGKTGSTVVTFPAASEIAVNYVEAGGAVNSNLTIGKLRRAKFLLTSTEAVDEDTSEELFAIVTASQIQSLLRTTEVTSADYNTVKALVAGEIDTFMGFKFKRTERLVKVGDNRECLFYPRSAIQLAIGEDTTVDVGPRRDKRNSIQIYVSMSFGASRMWEEKVLRCKCDETK